MLSKKVFHILYACDRQQKERERQSKCGILFISCFTINLSVFYGIAYLRCAEMCGLFWHRVVWVGWLVAKGADGCGCTAHITYNLLKCRFFSICFLQSVYIFLLYNKVICIRLVLGVCVLCVYMCLAYMLRADINY